LLDCWSSAKSWNRLIYGLVNEGSKYCPLTQRMRGSYEPRLCVQYKLETSAWLSDESPTCP
jgi:hypothetical protein